MIGSAQELLTNAGYVIRYKGAEGGFPLTRFLWGSARRALDGLAVYWFPGFYGWQFIFRCQVPEQEVAKPEKPPTAAV